MSGAATSSATEQAKERRYAVIAAIAVAAIALHLILRFGTGASLFAANLPLFVALAAGGLPLVWELAVKAWNREFGSDLLAGISIVTSVLLEEYLAGAIVVLMLSGGEALEQYAVRSASSVLRALAKRMPSVAHRRRDGLTEDIAVDQIAPGDLMVVMPHEICPVDGEVVEGHGSMDESFLTGEPYRVSKTPGVEVISGAVNGPASLTIRATKRPIDSRYAQIMKVMQQSEQYRPRIRRLGDQLGAFYTPLALVIAIGAWAASGEATRFLAVLVTATPCPLLIAIPVAIIGSISLSARRGIIIKNPIVLEQIDRCTVAIFDKTGTLTYGEPRLSEQLVAPEFDAQETLRLAASVERYSKHPLATAILRAARDEQLKRSEAGEIHEPPAQGLVGRVDGHEVMITHRKRLMRERPELAEQLPPPASGMECVVLIDDRYAATYRFRDQPRADGRSFIDHLGPRHQLNRVLLVSGDRRSEVEYLAGRVGIHEVHAEQSPEDKVRIVREETAKAKTIFLGDGINDAPALQAATVGIAFGQQSDVTAEAAGAVIMDSSLAKVDELLHISRRMRSIALQSAVGGMALSIFGMLFAAAGYLPPVAGALLQEAIDVLAVLNALRSAWRPRTLTDFQDASPDGES
ncbi:MAG: heavy metal translocating P-type ATPase [Planctomycetia bacterium]|nr:heavy metal translocating P-type ATPase [Planctomycetia bacterium]